jgi:hypothetical protein
MRAVIEVMLGTSTPTVLVASVVQAVLVAMTQIDNVVALVWIVKNMRELRCEPLLGELDAEIADKWLHTIEDSLNQMHVTEGL